MKASGITVMESSCDALSSATSADLYDVSENGHGDPNGKKTPESAPRDKTDPTSEPTTPAEAARQTLG